MLSASCLALTGAGINRAAWIAIDSGHRPQLPGRKHTPVFPKGGLLRLADEVLLPSERPVSVASLEESNKGGREQFLPAALFEG